MKHRLAFAIVLFSTGNMLAQEKTAAPLQYTALHIKNAITIDGNLDEKEWANAPWTTNFVDIEGNKKPLPLQQTRCKMLWNNQSLYIAAELKETDLWATLTQRDTVIFHNNDFEVFIDPDGDTKNYYEIEINALNAVWDLMLNKPYSKGGKPNNNWNARGMKTAVALHGTLNNPTDRDTSWIVEIAIPWKDFTYDQAPQMGSTWRINFSRVQWQLDVINKKYNQRINPETGRPLPEYNWVWSPQGVINMHVPEQWGYLKFE
ncbi:carbohydrate-binding family 9-like protein [Solitalea koreensis]|uniref:Carbohydrate family 9 binding domain-like n=1 Tax=Solitalea koreensis TaxID=543615 RepID=A0A521BZ29_9SPHI|nr:carbohydrate-binding family 9-like protein [Solitalea koreensis]SMO52433.1 Carbohydrate family 9 binding domain-like [Solitalea koreensis]